MDDPDWHRPTRRWVLWGIGLGIRLTLIGMLPHMACAGDAQGSPESSHAIEGLSRRAVEFNLAAGYTHTFRRTEGHVTKLQGVPVIVGMGAVATGPIGDADIEGR